LGEGVEMKNIDLIKNSVRELKKMRDDDESAHSFEDELRGSVLKDIASGKYSKKECQEFAREVLKTSKIDFARWCA